MSIRDNIEEIRGRIEKVKERTGRRATLIAVTKTVPVDKMQEAYREGISDFGENHVQEILKKYEYFPENVRWHLIGTLQTNKVRYIVDKVHLIHSLDRISLAKEIEKRAEEKTLTINCLVQVNISGEGSKHGLSEDEVADFIAEVSRKCPHIKIKGLMGMAAFSEDRDLTLDSFLRLNKLFEKIKMMNFQGADMEQLSMGMTNDYEIALEAGSTMVRVGTGIFGNRMYV